MVNDTQAIEDILFDAPIPGQSLTQSPDNPMPYERPPEYTNLEKAQEWLIDLMMDMGPEIAEQLNIGIPAAFIGTHFAMMGAINGKWNPDLMILLIEPAIYTVLFIAETAGIDYVLDFDEEFEQLDPSSRVKAEGHMQKVIKQVTAGIEENVGEGSVLEALPPSLLSQVKETPDE
jgi:hypothetical protein